MKRWNPILPKAIDTTAQPSEAAAEPLSFEPTVDELNEVLVEMVIAGGEVLYAIEQAKERNKTQEASVKEMNKPKPLNRMKFMHEGEEMSFRDFLIWMGGGEVIYEKEFRDVLMSWKYADYVYVDDYIAPLAAQVIVDAHELNPELYEQIMTLVEETHRSNREKIIPGYPKLTLVK